MAEKENIEQPDVNANINGKNINESTQFQFNITLKKLIIIIAFIVSSITGAWVDLKVRIDNASDESTAKIENFSSDIKEIKLGIDQLKDVDIRSVSDRINLVDGKVQGLVVILQSRSNNNVQPTHIQPVNVTMPSNPGNQ